MLRNFNFFDKQKLTSTPTHPSINKKKEKKRKEKTVGH
jgi:hypothetical protein